MLLVRKDDGVVENASEDAGEKSRMCSACGSSSSSSVMEPVLEKRRTTLAAGILSLKFVETIDDTLFIWQLSWIEMKTFLYQLYPCDDETIK